MAPADAQLGAGSGRIERAVREQQRVLAAATAMLDTARVENVHHGRVAARRLRSLLRTFRPLFEPRRARRYRTDLRSYARTLAAVREADVRRALLLSLLPEDPADIATDRNRLDALLTEQCNRARDSLRGHLHEEGWTALCRALDRHEGSGSLFVVRDAGVGQVLDLAAESWRRARRFFDDAPRSATGLHELRLALKHCRYALEPVVDEAPQAAAPLMRSLRRAQDALGEHRDTLLAQHWVQLNRRALGRSLAMHLATVLERHERNQRRAAARRARKAFESWKEWRDATRSLRKSRPQRASMPGPG
jgi:CHAD domain-containing protein